MFWKVVKMLFKARDAPTYMVAEFVVHEVPTEMEIPESIDSTDDIGAKSCPEDYVYRGAKTVPLRSKPK